MENASKALLISGGILIAMLVISIGVYLFANYGDMGSSYDQNMQATEIQKFNVNFTKFEGRSDITIQEIITLVKFAMSYEEETGTHIEISIPGKRDLVNFLKTGNSNEICIELIENNSEKKFKCENITSLNFFTDGNEKGKFKKIVFK